MFWFLLSLVFAVPLAAQGNHTQIEREVNRFSSVLECLYAPTRWKQERWGWNLESTRQEVLGELALKKNPSVQDCRCWVKRIADSVHDYHVKAYFHTTEFAALPFQVMRTENTYWVVSPCEELDIKVGDQILLWNNRPVEEEIEGLRSLPFLTSSPFTEQALAERRLTLRIAAEGVEVPSPNHEVVVLELLREGSEPHFAVVPWLCMPDVLSTPNQQVLFARGGASAMYEGGVMMVAGPSATPEVGKGPRSQHLEESWVPDLGPIFWRNPPRNKWNAYIFKVGQKRVGCIRIPNYMGDEKRVKELSALLGMMEKMTDALVIDQVNNGGGNAFYMFALLSRLSPVPLKVPLNLVAMTYAGIAYSYGEVADCDRLLEEASSDADFPNIAGFQFDRHSLACLRNWHQQRIDHWRAGRRLTDPISMFGVREIRPYNGTCYTKPILVLVNEMCFSGGDFFPSILQDNGRARIFGQRTAGAGGAVNAFAYPNPFGIAALLFTYTFTIRENGDPLEDLGVAPDVVYDLTKEDMVDNYSSYVSAVRAELERMLK